MLVPSCTVPGTCVPSHARILVLGGGPSGSYAASCLAREGFSVVVLEAEKFPRYHVGESMIPAMRHFLRFIDLDKTFDGFGFYRKNGAAFKLDLHKKEGYTDFVANDKNNYAWNVRRSQCDELMLRHAAACGALVFEETRATHIEFDPSSANESTTKTPRAVIWKNQSLGTTGRVTFDFLVDATGRRGILSTKYLQTRNYNASLKNIACWGYWQDTRGDEYDPVLSTRAHTPYFEALDDESGWAWFIPLSETLTSVGIVVDQEIQNAKKRDMDPGHSAVDYYLQELERAPDISKLIGDGRLIMDNPVIRTASDYSYSASSYAGVNYRIIGDAAAFIDPFFSSGVHLALTNGLSAAATISAVIRNDCSAQQAARWHSKRVGVSYTRFLIVVMSAYRQMRSRDVPILADVDEDNFDRAFENLRHVIQGTTDAPKTDTVPPVTEPELLQTLEYCKHIFDQTDERKKTEVRKHVRIASDLYSITEMVKDRMEGMVMRLERGTLGLNFDLE